MGKLFVVGTPIGNLKDMTLRAIDTLKSVDVIACEDTRHSLPLLNEYGIRKETVAYHKFNEAKESDAIIDLLLNGKNVALITDAGMPSISDPGVEIISKCHENNIDVVLVPGPTAFASAVTLSGLKMQGFTFLGFLPEKYADKVAIVSKAALSNLPIVLYVAPHDLIKTSEFLFETLGDRKVRVVRELTKIYESVTFTTLKNFECETRGEIVMIVEPKEEADFYKDLTVEQHIRKYLELGFDKKSAVKKVADDRNIPKNEVYKVAIDMN